MGIYFYMNIGAIYNKVVAPAWFIVLLAKYKCVDVFIFEYFKCLSFRIISVQDEQPN